MGAIFDRVKHAVGAAKSDWWATKPASGQIVTSDPRLDALLAAVSDNLNFKSLRAMLRAADDGDLAQGLKLFEEMQEKDCNLKSVAGTRIKAITGLRWKIDSASEADEFSDKKRADAAADFVRETLAGIKSFKPGLAHMDSAISSNLAVLEQVWDGARLVKFVPIQSQRLRIDPMEPGVVRVITADNREGVRAVGPKWVVHSPEAACGYPLARSLMRAQSFVYLIKMLAIADWTVFCEIFGMPIRIAKYQPTATPDEKTELINMMKNLGSKAFGVFSNAVTLEFVESSQRGTAPFKDLIEWCDRAQAKLFLGGNLVSDTTGGTGTFAAANVQDEVRDDLRDDDIDREADTVMQQIIEPMLFYRFWQEMPIPSFRRVAPETIDRKLEAETIRSAQAAGAKVPKKWALERMGIPELKEDDEVLEPPDPFQDELTEGFGDGA